MESPQGLPLVFLVPKQATFQIERAILDQPNLAGFTRLHILSFERLGHFIFEMLGKREPVFISEEGRIMVLRGLLNQFESRLTVFRKSSVRRGFAGELSVIFHELQLARLCPMKLRSMAAKTSNQTLGLKLVDLALLLEGYLTWMKDHQLLDAESLLEEAADAIKSAGDTLRIGGVWVDGFGKLNALERRLLIAIVPCSTESTIAFCAESIDPETPRINMWNLANQTHARIKSDLQEIDGLTIIEETLSRRVHEGRFNLSPSLAHLESGWSRCESFIGELRNDVEWISCRNAEEEVLAAARSIRKYVMEGGRYREIAVIVRGLEPWHEFIQRIFIRYEIPFFMDRREKISHHPLADMTRSALRIVTFGWRHVDIFNFLKSGLSPLDEDEVDWLENECLEFWGDDSFWNPNWIYPSHYNEEKKPQFQFLRTQITSPLEELEKMLNNAGTAAGFAEGVRKLWLNLDIQERLLDWNTTKSPALGLFHQTAYNQMESLLDNLVQAFGDERRSLSDWLTLIEAGFECLTVGLIPPALDQVLVGAVDRSRNPDLSMTLLLGLNEGVFPQLVSSGVLLGDHERDQLELLGASLSLGRESIAQQEQFLGYIAMTRARKRLVVTQSRENGVGDSINPSILTRQIKRFIEKPTVFKRINENSIEKALHSTELMDVFFEDEDFLSWFGKDRTKVLGIHPKESLTPGEAEKFYGDCIRTSVSRFERYAACPFQFFVDSGLRAKERMAFTLDNRERGSFQHKVLEHFHNEVIASERQWRDVTPTEGREMVRRIVDERLKNYSGGLVNRTARTQLVAEACKIGLQNLVGQLLHWMSHYEFDPVKAEFEFGDEQQTTLSYLLENGKTVRFQGKVDRIDLHRLKEEQRGLFVIMDYKSSQHQPNKLKIIEGLQQQLPAYLIMLRNLKNPQGHFGVASIEPIGMFYINMGGRPKKAKTREFPRLTGTEEQSFAKAFQHHGIFNVDYLELLDNRSEKQNGEQFKFTINRSGLLSATGFGHLSRDELNTLLSDVENLWKNMATDIYSGCAEIKPYRLNKETACDRCQLNGICRIDRWTHQNYRNVNKADHVTH